MPTMTRFGQNDIGTDIVIVIRDNSAARNISDASALVLTFKKPDNTTFTRTPDFVTDGADGKIHYVTEDGDLDDAGEWAVQAQITTPDGTWSSGQIRFAVDETL